MKNAPGEKAVKNDNLASSFASNETAFKESFDKMLEKFDALE